MITKIIAIKNVGRFKNYNCQNGCNSDFKSNTVIYAENGSGKTTLSLILKSLHGNHHLLSKKQTFGTSGNQYVELMTDTGSITYQDAKWSSFNKNIAVFDIHYIEDNLYTGSSLPDKSKTNLFEVVLGQKGIRLKSQIVQLINEKKQYAKEKKEIVNRLKYDKHQLHEKDIQAFHIQKEYLEKKIKELADPIKLKNRELGLYSKKVFETHIEEINNQLKYFTSNIQIKKFSNQSKKGVQLLSYYLSVGGYNVTFDHNTKNIPSIKYTLSEGDKSAIALAFFLAKTAMSRKLEEKIIVFDDPISSFDHSRRNATINQLVKLSTKVKQVIVLTHDLYFARDVANRLQGGDLCHLKINQRAETSEFIAHDIHSETLPGVFKDISVLKHYLAEGAKSDLEKREVVRCIRPIVEGIIRIKYFTVVPPNEWLGGMIYKAKKCNDEHPMARLKPILEELSEINDYSKSFHHSDPTNPLGDYIDDQELRIYVHRTLTLIQKI